MAKAAWLSLNYVSPSNAEGASPVTDHIKYIGQESDGGVDLTHTQRDIEAAVGTDLSEHEALIKYISERPGVDAQGEAHGLWGKDGVADIDATIKEIEGLENAVHYRGVFSLNRATSQEIGVEEKEQWQRHTEAAMKKTAEKLGIDYEDFEWRAAFHNASDQNPHVHIVFWDGKDRPTERIGSYGEPGHIPKEMLKSIRADWTKEFYGIYRNQIFEQKGAARDASLMIAKGLTTGAESMTTVKSEDLTELVKDFEKLSKMMPGTGRTAYKYMSPFVKAQCDVVVGKLMDHPLIKEEVDTYVSNHVELSRHHGDDVVVHLRHNIKQTAKEISAKELLKGASDKEVDLFISALQQAKIYEKTSLKLISGATGGDLSESSVLERYVAIKDLRKPLVSLSGNSEWWALRSKLDVADVDRQEGSLDRAAAWARGDLEERMRSSVLQGAKACQGELMVDEIARLTPLVRSAGSLRDASEAEMLMYARLLGTTDISDAECVASLFEASGETLSIEEAKDLLALARTKSSPPTIKDWREWKFKEGILRHSRYVTEGKTLSKGSDIETYVRALKTAGVEKENIFELVKDGFEGSGNELQREAYLRGLASSEKVDFKEWQAFRTIDNVAHAHLQYSEEALLVGSEEQIRELYTHALTSTQLTDEQIADAVQLAVAQDESREITNARIQEVRDQREATVSSKDWSRVRRVAWKAGKAQGRIIRHVAVGGAAKVATAPLRTQEYLTQSMRACGFTQQRAYTLLEGLYPTAAQDALKDLLTQTYSVAQVADTDTYFDYLAAKSVGDTVKRVTSAQLLKDNPELLGALLSDSMHFAGYSQADIDEALIAGGASSQLVFESKVIGSEDIWNAQAIFSIKASWKLPIKTEMLLGHNDESLSKYFEGLRAAGIDKEAFAAALYAHDPEGDYHAITEHMHNTASGLEMNKDIRQGWAEFREADLSLQALGGLQSDEFVQSRGLTDASEEERLAVAKVLVGGGMSKDESLELMQEASDKDEDRGTTEARLEQADTELKEEQQEREEQARKWGKGDEVKERGASFEELFTATKLTSKAALVMEQKADLAQGLELGAFDKVTTMPAGTQKLLTESMRAATFTQEEAAQKLTKLFADNVKDKVEKQVAQVYRADSINKEALSDFKLAYDVCEKRPVFEVSKTLSGANQQDREAFIQGMKCAGYCEKDTTRSFAKATGQKANDTNLQEYVKKNYNEGSLNHQDWTTLKANDSTRKAWIKPLERNTLSRHTERDQRAYIAAIKRAGITKAVFVKAAKANGFYGDAESIYEKGAQSKQEDREVTKGWYEFKTNNSIISTAPLMVEAQGLAGASEADREIYTRALLRTGMKESDVTRTVHGATGGDENFSKTVARTQACAKMPEPLSSKEWHDFMNSKSEIFQKQQGMGAGAAVGQCMLLLKNLADMTGKKQEAAQPAMQISKGKHKGAGKFKPADHELERGIEHKQDSVMEAGI